MSRTLALLFCSLTFATPGASWAQPIEDAADPTKAAGAAASEDADPVARGSRAACRGTVARIPEEQLRKNMVLMKKIYSQEGELNKTLRTLLRDNADVLQAGAGRAAVGHCGSGLLEQVCARLPLRTTDGSASRLAVRRVYSQLNTVFDAHVNHHPAGDIMPTDEMSPTPEMAGMFAVRMRNLTGVQAGLYRLTRLLSTEELQERPDVKRALRQISKARRAIREARNVANRMSSYYACVAAGRVREPAAGTTVSTALSREGVNDTRPAGAAGRIPMRTGRGGSPSGLGTLQLAPVNNRPMAEPPTPNQIRISEPESIEGAGADGE